MFSLNDTMRYHLCTGFTDMRKGINSLIGVIKEKLGLEVRNGDVSNPNIKNKYIFIITIILLSYRYKYSFLSVLYKEVKNQNDNVMLWVAPKLMEERPHSCLHGNNQLIAFSIEL